MTYRNTSQASIDASAESEELDRLSSLVNQFIDMMDKGNISRLKLQYGDLKLSLTANHSTPDIFADTDADIQQTVSPRVDAMPSGNGAIRHVVSAPMIGTFYIAPAPNEPPFVLPGDAVEEGQTIGIIEAMKIMNEIAAEIAGEVVEVVAQNGQTVEYGSPLVMIAPEQD